MPHVRLSRRLLMPPTAAALALVAVAACADPVSSPVAAEPSLAVPAAHPSFEIAPISGGQGENFDSSAFRSGTATVDPLLTWRGDPIYTISSTGLQVAATANVPIWASVHPVPWKPTTFDVAIHMRDRAFWYTPEPFRGMHGTDCSPFQETEILNPAGTQPNGIRANGHHPVTTYDGMNYRCRNHMMTAIKATGYGVIYVTPGALLDLGSPSASVKFALSTYRTSGNDWIDLWITPWSDNLTLPLDNALSAGGVDLQGVPRRAIHVRMSSGNRNVTTFTASYIDNWTETPITSTNVALETVLNPNNEQSPPVSTRRDTFELKLAGNTIQFGWKKVRGTNANKVKGDEASHTWINTTLPASVAAWGASVVQFGHHSQSIGADAEPATEGGGTWHWDDFQILPGVPFTIIKPKNATIAGAGYANADNPVVTVPGGAPLGSYLRFAGYGEKVEVSFDGEKNWVKADRQLEKLDVSSRFHSYWMPIPAGVTRIAFRAKKDPNENDTSNRDQGPWLVRNIAIWKR